MKRITIITLLLFFMGFVMHLPAKNKKNNSGTSPFVVVKDGQFVAGGKPCYFIGTNFWYGAILGSKAEGGNRERLLRELDFLKAQGISNLRILIGADGENGVPSKVEPTLQIKPGVYNDVIFDGLDFLLAEMGKRNMNAVLYFTNSWEWSGGYSQYLNWLGKGKNPIPSVDGWPAYMEYVKQYAGCTECKELLKKHIKKVITRNNRYTGKKYIDDPTIFSWQIGNEPRAFSDENKPLFAAWLRDISAYIKSLDKNHMVSIGSEGKHGCEQDMALFEQIHADPNVDYLTAHIWPKNWGWLDVNNMQGTLQACIDKTAEYMQIHTDVARRLKKPVVIEEFGFPRDHHEYNLKDSTSFRDQYYASVFRQIQQSAQNNDVLAGCNFWAWGGFGRPQGEHVFWQKGDDYLGDPAQEEQGLNSVFDTDATIRLIKNYTDRLKGKTALVDDKASPETRALYARLKNLMNKGIMVAHQDDAAYGHGWYGKPGGSDVKAITGDYPAVNGWEIGHIEIDAPYNLDSIYFTDMKRLIGEVHERGGINTISWHGDNIATGKTAWDCAQDTVVRSILPDGSNHAKFLKYLDKVADFFCDLKDKNGRLIPVIFRMYHEHTGSWFWWGAKQCTPDEYNELYRMTVKFLRDKKGVHNLLYAFSPADVATEQEYLLRYPGDEWVDIVGFDTYAYGTEPKDIELYKKKMSEGLHVVTRYAARTGKIPVMAETGMEGIKVTDYFTNILLPVIQPFKISYVLLWRNAYTIPTHYYVPFPGHPAADDFRKFAESPLILLNSEVND
ncbi:MAG: Mannan endo-1,4-beta-mannosidase [Bacteroidetes bacterium]|nr:Mannan endo-1,4-beta-mannosidase [Bacteroidota bacterium]